MTRVNQKVRPFHIVWSKFASSFMGTFQVSWPCPAVALQGGKHLTNTGSLLKKLCHIVTLSCWWPRGPGIKSHWGEGPESKQPPPPNPNHHRLLLHWPEWERFFHLGLGMGEVTRRWGQRGRTVEVEIFIEWRDWNCRGEGVGWSAGLTTDYWE